MSLPFVTAPSFPALPLDVHKGRMGRVGILAGSRRMPGAPRLVARAAFAAGTGLVTVLAPKSVLPVVQASDPLILGVGLRETHFGTVAHPALESLIESLANCDALVVGPGLGRHPDTDLLVRELLRSLLIPVVVDADALTALALGGDPPNAWPASRILTPHPGEAARLANAEIGVWNPSARQELHLRLIEKWHCVVVLKGPATLVGDVHRRAVNPTGNPGLAVGGSGDVLAGMIGAFVAGGLEADFAASAAVYLQGLASDRLASAGLGERAQTPLDLLKILPTIVAEHEARRIP